MNEEQSGQHRSSLEKYLRVQQLPYHPQRIRFDKVRPEREENDLEGDKDAPTGDVSTATGPHP